MRRISLFAAVCLCAAAWADLPNWTVTWTNDAQTAGEARNDQNGFVLRVYRTSSYGGFGLGVGIEGSSKSGAGIVASAGTPEYLDMRGTITGLDPRHDPPTNAVWKFSHLRPRLFCPTDVAEGTGNATPSRWLSGLRSPGTIVMTDTLDLFHIDGQPKTISITEIIYDEPNYTGRIGAWGLNGIGNGLQHLVFRVPKVELMSDPLSHGSASWKADVGEEWDFSGMKQVGSSNELGEPSFGPLSNNQNGMTGILRLPSLFFIAAKGTGDGSAFRCGIHEAELGLRGYLRRLATHSFNNCNNLTNIVIGRSPADTGLTIHTNAFNCKNIQAVWFDGEKPKFPGEAGTYAFGTPATAEGQITFYVRDIPSWADVLAEADANDGWVSAATLRTVNRQKVARYTGYNKVTVELQDPRFAERYHEAVTLTPVDGDVRNGMVRGAVTIAATCAEPDDAATDPRRAKFLRWDGVPVELERVNPLTFTPTKDMKIQAVFAHDWLMSDDAEPDRVMENGFWRICCYICDRGNKRISTGRSSTDRGKGSMWPKDPERRMGGGDLNMNGDIWDSAGNKWTLVALCNMSYWRETKSDGTSGCPSVNSLKERGLLGLFPTRYTMPETLLTWPGEVQNYDSWGDWPLKEVIAICPEATGALAAFMIGGANGVKRLLIRAPKLTRLGSNNYIYGFSWSGSTFAETDLSEWDLSGITDVSANACRFGADCAATGTLDLPNVRNIGTNAFLSLKKMTGMTLGTNGLTVATIDDRAFHGALAMTSLTIGTKGLTLGSELGAESVFARCAALEEVHLPGPALPAEQMDALLQAVPETDGAKQVTVYASPFFGWTQLAAAPTATEAEVAPADCFGVYRAGLRKAWFVKERSPFEPKGTVLIFR